MIHQPYQSQVYEQLTFILKITFSLTSVTDFLTTSEVMVRRVHGSTLLAQTTAVQVQPAAYGFHQSNVLMFHLSNMLSCHLNIMEFSTQIVQTKKLPNLIQLLPLKSFKER